MEDDFFGMGRIALCLSVFSVHWRMHTQVYSHYTSQLLCDISGVHFVMDGYMKRPRDNEKEERGDEKSTTRNDKWETWLFRDSQALYSQSKPTIDIHDFIAFICKVTRLFLLVIELWEDSNRLKWSCEIWGCHRCTGEGRSDREVITNFSENITPIKLPNYLPVDKTKQRLGYSNRYRDWATVCKPMDQSLTSSRSKSFSLLKIFQISSRAENFSIQWVQGGPFPEVK